MFYREDILQGRHSTENMFYREHILKRTCFTENTFNREHVLQRRRATEKDSFLLIVCLENTSIRGGVEKTCYREGQ